MRSKGRQSPPPVVRDRNGIPIVHLSPSRPTSKSTKSFAQEEDNDEIQLCNIPAKTAMDNTHRNHVEYFARTYQSPSNASSPRLDSWQDASTEPITPLKGDGILPPVYSPPSRPLKKHPFPSSPNPIESPPRRLFSSTSLKRKTEDFEMSPQPLKKLSRLSSHSKKMDIATLIEPNQPVDPSPTQPNHTPQVTPTENDLKVELPLETVTQAAKENIPAKVEIKEDSKPAEANISTKEGEAKEKEEQQPENKKFTKEEEAIRIAEEINHLMKTVKSLPNYYKLIDKIGEGTFSTVYKALDVRRDYYDNSDWEPQLLSSPTSSPGEEEMNNSKTIYDFVALKRIYHTSSPRRIANEIAILRRLKGCSCISPLITAFRQQDQVFVVMPYIQHDDFKRTFTDMSMIDIKYYLRSLFTALEHIHKHKILHRDVKPNNFLYSRKKKTGYLIDFGLAEHEDESKKLEEYMLEVEAKSQNNVFLQSSRAAATSNITSALAALTNKENLTSKSVAVAVTGSSTSRAPEGSIIQKGYVRNDARHQVRANRAGTRGFRAPEILMRVTRQTGAIDIWAAGIILLCFLTGRYPFFIANDESDAIIELVHIFGTEEIKECAANYKRAFSTNLHLPKNRMPMDKMCECLNKERTEKWDKADFKSGIDLLNRCIDLNFKTRATATEVLQHPFLKIQEEKKEGS